ncbi:hypothetical protein INR49_017561 [Caranx melampygus]|nr:hypothetical protein INR49_017561 [Caranx melampygus]
MDYLSLGHNELPSDVAEHIISRGLQDMLLQRQIVLHWIDSRSQGQVLRCKNSLGFNKLSEVLAHVDGRVIPVVAILDLCSSHELDSSLRTEAFAFKSSIGYLLSSESLYRLAFPVIQGILLWEQGDLTQSCDITIEPVSRRQRLLPESVEVRLKGVLQGWDASSLTQAPTESWALQCPSSTDQGAATLQHLLVELSAHALHMLAEVNDGSLVYSAVLSPWSQSTALLTVLQPGITQHNPLTTETVTPARADTSADLPDVVSSVLGVVYDIMEEDSDCVDVPDWAQQEVSRCPLTAGVLEIWFPQSDQSGVSSHLMESMRLLHAVPEHKEEDETSALQQELISGLADLYQTSQDTDNKRGKKRGAQRTPVKRKMKTMSRSLQMLNVARLNVKAQKNQAEAEQLGQREGHQTNPGKDGPVTGTSLEQQALSVSVALVYNHSFTSEAELLSHLRSNYEKILAGRDSSVLTGVQQLLYAVKTFLGAEPHLEVKTSTFVQQHLLKTSKSIRQLYGMDSDVDGKVRECQLQAVLRLELCRLSSSKQSDSLDADQMAEEVAEMLRIISLTKDPVCLARFLQDDVLPGSGMLTRHRSMTESSQSLRQIEIPKKTTRASKSKMCVALEKPVAEPQPQKQETQVRRNLFNQEVVSPSKKAKLPRSQSVSAVEGLKRKRSHEYEDLRRSPRIKKFARKHSNTFYSSSQPRSRNLEKALSASQLALSDSNISGVNVKTVRSPMHLLFGAADSPVRPSDQSATTRATRSRLSADSSVFESPSKTPTRSPSNTTPKTPRTSHTKRSPKTPPSYQGCVAERPAIGRSPEFGITLRGSPFRSPGRRTLVVDTPTKQSPLRSPLKGILRTPVKAVDSQQFDSSHLNSATTDDDSMDIVDAEVIKTEFSGGLKMNISFSRKPSQSGEDLLLNTASPKPRLLHQGTPGRSYGFRQTPDRQQREAAARLGYGNESPRFSTPRGPTRLGRQKHTSTPNSMTYQVEMEMQTSGLPKLKFKRTDSMNAGDLASDGGPRSGVQSSVVGGKPSQLESPLALFSKHRDPGCVSPSVCTHVTPAKSTPGKGGSVQTYICQSYTPTHHPGGTISPKTIPEIIPLTPSPQSVGKVTPDNFSSWPRRKRAQAGVVGGKDRILKGEPLLEEMLEEAELGVSRLQDIEDIDEPSNDKAVLSLTTNKSPPVAAGASPPSPLEDWMEKLSEQADCTESQTAEEEILWTAANGDVKSIATPPSSKATKPVTASGILALTHSPLLFKGSARKRTPDFKGMVYSAY